jgi:hypothetical protein
MYLTWKRTVVWDLRDMGSAWGREVKAGMALQKGGKISSHAQQRQDNMGKDEENQPIRA